MSFTSKHAGPFGKCIKSESPIYLAMEMFDAGGGRARSRSSVLEEGRRGEQQ
jgi:hypothetical protein